MTGQPQTPPLAPRTFDVRFSPKSTPTAAEMPTNNLGLVGDGTVSFDDGKAVFASARGGFRLGSTRGEREIPLADIANVESSAESHALIIRTRDDKRFVLLWAADAEDFLAIRERLPTDVTPEFLARRAHQDSYERAMQQLGGTARATPVLIGLNFAVFAIMLLAGAHPVRPDPAVLVRFGSNFGPFTWGGEPWRLLTSAFLHFGIVHLVLNVFALYQGGGLVERLYGSGRFILLYLLSALAGSVLSGWWDPSRNSAGASGAIFGVYGALLAFMLVRRADIPGAMVRHVGTSAGLFCAYSLVFGAAHPLIDNAAHIGGLMGGFISGLLLARPLTADARREPNAARLLLATAAVCVPLAILSVTIGG